MRDRWLRRSVLAHFLSSVAEWAVTVGLLVHAFSWGGAGAVGALSLVVLVSPLVCTPLVGSAMLRWRPHAVRAVGFATQVAAYLGATVSVALDAPSPVVAAFVVIGLAGALSIPPTGAALLPLIARSADDLISANLWVGHCNSASALIGSLSAGLVLGASGPGALFALCALAATIALVATAWHPVPLARYARSVMVGPQDRPIRRILTELRARPWSRGVLAVASARNLLVGAFDVLLVVVALDVLDLGDGGPGYLSALVGAGALFSTLIVTVIVRRARLQRRTDGGARRCRRRWRSCSARGPTPRWSWSSCPIIGVAMAANGRAQPHAAAAVERPPPARSALSGRRVRRRVGPTRRIGDRPGGDRAWRAHVWRSAASAAPGRLGDRQRRSLRLADAHAELPVVEMTLLSGLPVFSSLPTPDLEQVARLAVHERVEPNSTTHRAGRIGARLSGRRRRNARGVRRTAPAGGSPPEATRSGSSRSSPTSRARRR